LLREGFAKLNTCRGRRAGGSLLVANQQRRGKAFCLFPHKHATLMAWLHARASLD